MLRDDQDVVKIWEQFKEAITMTAKKVAPRKNDKNGGGKKSYKKMKEDQNLQSE